MNPVKKGDIRQTQTEGFSKKDWLVIFKNVKVIKDKEKPRNCSRLKKNEKIWRDVTRREILD